MANSLSPELLQQMYAQESGDPFLALLTLTHSNFSTIRLVNNGVKIVSRGHTFDPYDFSLTLPPDDGDTAKTAQIEIDNTTLEFIDEIRSSTTPISVKIELILASIPDAVQYELPDMKINTVTYSTKTITATLSLDGFLQAAMNAEKYTPSNYPGLF